MRQSLTISNILSASRAVLVIPIGYCLVSDFQYNRYYALAIVAFAIVTDFLDGFLARKLHHVSDLGKFLDPLADKIGIGVYAIIMAWTGDVPLWFIILVLVRDAVIFSGGVVIKLKKKIVPQSNWPGKISVSLIAWVFFLGTIQVDPSSLIYKISIWVSVGMMIWSVWSYGKRLFIGRHVEVKN